MAGLENFFLLTLMLWLRKTKAFQPQELDILEFQRILGLVMTSRSELPNNGNDLEGLRKFSSFCTFWT